MDNYIKKLPSDVCHVVHGEWCNFVQGKGECNCNSEKIHIDRHKELHKYLDELVADFISKTNKLPSKTTIIELMEWSCSQAKME